MPPPLPNERRRMTQEEEEEVVVAVVAVVALKEFDIVDDGLDDINDDFDTCTPMIVE